MLHFVYMCNRYLTSMNVFVDIYLILVDMLENCVMVPPDTSSVYTHMCLALEYAVLT